MKVQRIEDTVVDSVAMVALVDHLGFGYGPVGGSIEPTSVQVVKGQRFMTNAGRAVRLIEKGMAALDVSEEPEDGEVVVKIAESKAVKVGEPVAMKRKPGRPKKAR